MSRPNAGVLLPMAWCILATSAAVSVCEAQAADGFTSMFRYVPEGANVALYVDAANLRSTPLAQNQGWFDPHGDAGRPMYVPSEADQIFVASRLDPSGLLTPQWDVALMKLSTPIDLAAAARAEGGYPDKLGGREAVWTPSGAYLFPFESKLLGEYAPADRQAAAKWAAAVTPPATFPDGLSDYLKSAEASVGEKSQIVMAIDLADAFPPHAVRSAVTSVLAGKPEASRTESISRTLTTIKGVTILLEIGETARGTIRFDFAGKSDAPKGIEKELFEGLLGVAGATLPDLDKWQIKATANSVTAHADVSANGLRRLLSLIQVPTTKFSSLADAKPAPSEQELVASASVEYFRTVSSMLDDLRESLSDVRGNEALYMERYARKIDRLPILNVDDELLDWGNAVAETLRGGGQDVRSAGLRSGVRKSAAYGTYQYNYDGYGYYSGQSTESQLAQVTRQEGATARASVYGSWKELEDGTADIRRAMTKKYGVEF